MSGETDQVRWRGVRPIDGVRGVWPEKDAERINKIVYNVGAGTFVGYTVPAGKKLFISSVIFPIRLTVAALGTSYGFVRDASDTLVYYIIGMNFAVQGQWSFSNQFCPALEVPAGFDVCLYTDLAGLDAWMLFFGWLEDA